MKKREWAWEKILRKVVQKKFKDITIKKIEKIPYIYCCVCSTPNDDVPAKLNRINDEHILCDFCLSKLEVEREDEEKNE